MSIIDRLRKRLVRWLLKDADGYDSRYFDCHLPTPEGSEIVTYLAVGTQGPCLLARPSRSDGQTALRLITPNQAIDPDRFWELHRQLGGSRLTWGDGTPVNR